MSKGKSKARKLLEQRIKNNSFEDMFLQSEEGLEKPKVNKTKKDRGCIPPPPITLTVKINFEEMTTDDSVGILDFRSAENKDRQLQEKKLKLLNLLTMKNQSLHRIELEQALVNELQPFCMDKFNYDMIINQVNNCTDHYKKDRLYMEKLSPFLIYYLKFRSVLPVFEQVYCSKVEENRAYKLLKYYYNISNPIIEVREGTEYIKFDIRTDIGAGMKKRLQHIYNEVERLY